MEGTHASDSGTRLRVVSTKDGFRGRPKGKHFDVTADEFAAHGPDGDGVLALVPGVGLPVTPAAVREAVRAGVDIGDVPRPKGRRVTAKAVKAMRRK